MRTLTFQGGPCDGLEAVIDARDAIVVVQAARLMTLLPVQVPQVVVLGAGGRDGVTPFCHEADFVRAHQARLFVAYHRWPGEDDGPIDYRTEAPPRPVYRSWPVSASG